MSRIILPNGQHIRPENEVLLLRREVNRLKRIVIQENDKYQETLKAQEFQLRKLDQIMEAAFQKIEAYERYLIKSGIDPKGLIDGDNGRKDQPDSKA